MDLVPQKEGQPVTLSIWEEYSSDEHKWELWDGMPFGPDGRERDRLLLCLLYSMGLEHFAEKILPDEAKEILKELLEK